MFAKLRNLCEIESSQSIKYMVNDDTVVLLIYQKSDNSLDEVRAFHKEMDCVCYENHKMGLYFISDPDGYWIEILPLHR